MPDVGALANGDTNETQMVEEVVRQSGPFIELGASGLKRASGYVDEEFLPQLKGKKAIQVFREMSENDPIVGALLFAVDKLIRNVDWPVVPAGKSRDDANAAKLVETAMEDMSHSWDDLISEVLSCLIYGWSFHEIVYKRRMGPWQNDGRRRSKHSDGLVGWRKMPIRAQETLQRWVFDETGGVRAMIQLAPPTYRTTVLPMEKGLLFRYGHIKNSPEGRSMLRSAYRPWYYVKRLQEFEAIGVERDLAGLPIVKVPAEYLKARPGTEQAKMVEAFKKMIRSIRRDEQEGVVFPNAFDQDTKQPLFNLELLGGGGARAFNTDALIQRYEQRILMTVLADFIMVGHTRTGTYNMHVDKTAIFRTALNATTQSIAEVFNRYAIPRLFAANGWKPAQLPSIQPSDVDAPDINQLASFLSSTAGLGFNWGPDADLERFLRHAAGLPELADDEYNKHRTLARREEATRFAESQTRYLAARSMLAQQMAQQQMQASGEPMPEQVMQSQQMEQQQIQQQQASEQHELGVASQLQQLASGGGNVPRGTTRNVPRGTTEGG